ncbi:MAG: hypothetical protein CMB80_08875 [Flammeovirgaceae bacterium]|nr:hypothetical protein [Flammeovirgaceae bacterium]|tara:strand:- start:1357 stop:1725 length:369 start_codon:yes stop_codon:yes gene_type:complete
MSNTKIDNMLNQYKNSQEKIDDFGELLDSIEASDDKKKLLWKEIYQNAVIDRENAGMLFTDAFKQMQIGTAEHVSLGSTLAKYIERMCKSNEQILRLTELITKSEERTSRINPDELFDKIGN